MGRGAGRPGLSTTTPPSCNSCLGRCVPRSPDSSCCVVRFLAHARRSSGRRYIRPTPDLRVDFFLCHLFVTDACDLTDSLRARPRMNNTARRFVLVPTQAPDISFMPSACHCTPRTPSLTLCLFNVTQTPMSRKPKTEADLLKGSAMRRNTAMETRSWCFCFGLLLLFCCCAPRTKPGQAPNYHD